VAKKPTYEELAKRVKELEIEKLQAKIINGPLIKSSEWLSDKLDLQPSPEISSLDVDLESIIDAEEIQSIMDDFCYLTNMVTAVLDLKGKVIAATGWQDICTKFHRINPKTAQNCTESDLFLAKNLKPGEYIEYKCKNGLWDVVTPLYVGTKHLGNIFTGQFFYDDEKVDEDFFIKQADKYGFDKDSYLESFKRVPRYNRDTIYHLMGFLVKFTTYLSKISLSNRLLEKEIKKRKKTETALRISEENLATTLHSIGDGVISTDKNGLIVQMNPMAENLCGWKLVDAAGKPLAEVFRIVNAQTRETVADPVKKVLESKGVVGLANHTVLISKNGTEYQIADSAAPIKTKEGVIRGVVLVFSDVTETYLDQKLIRESEEDLKESQRIAHVGSWRLNISTNKVVWSEELYKIYGFDPTLPPPPYTEHMKLFTPESWDRLSASLARTSETGIPYELELEMVREDEKNGWMWVRGEAEKDSEGIIIGLWGVAQDITDRKRDEETLSLQSEIINRMSEGVSLVGEDGIIIYTNPEFETMFGYDSYEMRGLHVSIVNASTEKNPEKTAEEIFNILNIKGVWSGEIQNVKKDGTTFWSAVNVTAMEHSKYGKSFVSVHTDISELKQVKNERKKLEAKLQQAQKMESIGNLAGGIAHDFNNLLFPIIGMSEMLLEDLPQDSLEHENAQEIFNAGKRAGDLVKQILAFSRQSEHKMTPIRIQRVLKEVLKLCRSTIPSNVEIQETIDWECGLIMADATQLHQVAMNLITNAFHAIEEKSGFIDITLKKIELKIGEIPNSLLPPDQYIQLSVADNGVGMSQRVQQKIFDPYFTTKEMGKGTGLGLAVVYGIIKGHKGDIKVYSEEGKGSTFHIYLPLMKTNAMPVIENQSLYLPTGIEKILLVDDEISVAKLEAQMLSRLGYQVTEQTNSSEALNEFKTNPENFDLVISDMTMPNMTGDQLAKEILSIKPNIPIIICTGFSERINKEHTEVIGVKGFLMKPVGKFDMAQMVRKVLDEAKIS
jgi:PAS domain S-box-containing protein